MHGRKGFLESKLKKIKYFKGSVNKDLNFHKMNILNGAYCYAISVRIPGRYRIILLYIYFYEKKGVDMSLHSLLLTRPFFATNGVIIYIKIEFLLFR
jgi:hypothetical protein